MLLEARRAGQELLAQKAVTPHGQFKAWIEENTRVSYPTAKEYMRVARLTATKRLDLQLFDGGIRAFLDAHAGSHSKPNAKLSLSEDDALYAKKLHALAERGVGGEAETARTKLTAYAKTFGKTAEELMQEVGRVAPEPEPMSVMDRTILKAMEPFQRCSKDNLLNLLLFSICEYPDLLAKLREREHLLAPHQLTD